ncbi:unnamed protein product [Commensalibacter communis]|uniref:hypothetical protein n=1 Tax=Commensalibacter communis TaxID=2972786 RepID=UPI0022FF55D5|nr:hypothetical protein [Commensalibacter communis]CAI3926916.1 unnamed protein product [Commensalibacter communis]CAI3932422.1 unnamed protein product [Commensalibacter communis]
MVKNKKQTISLIVGIFSTFLIGISNAMAYVPAGNVGFSWQIGKFVKPYNNTGLTNLTFRFTVNKNTLHATGTYFAQQFYFNNSGNQGNGAYTGLQPQYDINGKQYLRAVFSSFIANSTTTDPNCSNGADGGPGVSCGVVFPTTYGHNYKITVKKTTGNTWSGDLQDEQTGQTVHIGSWTLPSTVSNLQTSGSGFAEYYAFYKVGFPQFVVPSCNLLAKISVFYGPVTSTDFGGAIGNTSKMYFPFEYNTDCIGSLSNFSSKTVSTKINMTPYQLTGYGYQIERGWVSTIQ